jgi:exodeoxyribonuclease V alpha subunit
MQVRNNYDLEWEKDGEAGRGIFSGDIGTIQKINYAEETMTILFDDRETAYEFQLLDELEHAYAITIHKSQGSEYPVVIIPAFAYVPRLMTRNLLYTAVTRAQEKVILVGQKEVVCGMVDNDRQVQRYTGLSHLLAAYET